MTKPIPAGFKTTKAFVADESTTTEEGLAALRTAVERQRNETDRAMHPAFGKISKEAWDDFNLRHAETHLSFIVPEQN